VRQRREIGIEARRRPPLDHLAHPPVQLGAPGDADVVVENASQQGVGEGGDPRLLVGHDARRERLVQSLKRLGRFNTGRVGHDVQRELLPHDSGVLEQLASLGTQSRQPFIEHRTHRRRYRGVPVTGQRCKRVVPDQPPGQLGREQWVPGGHPVQRLGCVRPRIHAHRLRYELAQLARAEPGDRHSRPRALELHTKRSRVGTTVAHRHREQDRQRSNHRRQVHEQTHGSLVGPLDVVDHQQTGPALRQAMQRLCH